MERGVVIFAVLFLSLSLSAANESSNNGEMIVNSTAKLGIVCHNKYIEVTVESKNYPGLDTNVTHLEDVSCVPGYRDEDKVVFKFGLEDCKTEQEVDEDNIYYKNKVIAIVKDEVEDSEITRSNTRVLPFQCAYKKQALLSKVRFTPKSIMIVSDADDFGNFTYRIYLYTNEDYSTKVDTFPFLVGVGQQLYLEKSVESGDPKVVLFPDECKATPSPDINAKPDYMIIEKACPRDKTVEYDYKMSASQRFSLGAFRFKSGYDDVYIHCTLTVCRSDDMQSKCAKGCQLDGNSTRKRREVADNYRASLYLGPIKMTDGKENKALDAPLSKDSTDDNPQWFLLVGLLVSSLGIIALVLIAAIILVLKRRGRTKRTTSLLVQEAE